MQHSKSDELEREVLPGFQYLASDSLRFAWTSDGAKIAFGILDNGKVIEQVGVSLTPKTAKMLSILMDATIKNYESTSGVTVPFDQDKIDAIKKIMESENTKSVN